MDLFEYGDKLNYGELHLKMEASLGLRAIVAIHNLKFGPAIGGCRFIEYSSTDEALQDAMRLARGMSYKAAITGLPHGGGKAVIVRPPGLKPEQRKALFAEYAAFVDSLGGRYITCEDSGTTVEDMNVVKGVTDHVLGYDPDLGSSGDPSPLTALGVRRGIEAAVKFKYDRDDLEGLTIAVQGVGSVGYHLARDLSDLGASVIVTDVNESAIARCEREFGARRIEPDAIFSTACDIFAPCALGAVINDKTLPQLKCDIIAGAANNQLAEAHHGAALKERGILYAPDYAINAGGLINVAAEYDSYDIDKVRSQVEAIYDTLLEIFERSASDNAPCNATANRIVEERLFN